MQFDSTINLGHILTFVGFLIGGLTFVLMMRSQLSIMGDHLEGLGTRMQAAERELKTMTNVLVTLGRQDERLNSIDRRIDDLQHGRGFVLEPGLPRALRSGGDD